jgi:hypothetical protein
MIDGDRHLRQHAEKNGAEADQGGHGKQRDEVDAEILPADGDWPAGQGHKPANSDRQEEQPRDQV